MLQTQRVGVKVALTLLALSSSFCAPTIAPTRPAARPTEPARVASTLASLDDSDETDDTVPHGQQTPLRLPFRGAWIVGQGYHGSESHHGRAAFALDLVKLDAEDKAYARSGRRPQDWVGFGAALLAAAAGVVVRAIDRHPDGPVIDLDARNNGPPGRNARSNTVIIQHHATEFSEYVHLQRGSLRVAIGDEVVQGQVLARCGNAGSQTPHLHWALLSSLDPIRTRPAVFAEYEVRDEHGVWHLTHGTPRSGQLIRNRAP